MNSRQCEQTVNGLALHGLAGLRGYGLRGYGMRGLGDEVGAGSSYTGPGSPGYVTPATTAAQGADVMAQAYTSQVNDPTRNYVGEGSYVDPVTGQAVQTSNAGRSYDNFATTSYEAPQQSGGGVMSFFTNLFKGAGAGAAGNNDIVTKTISQYAMAQQAGDQSRRTFGLVALGIGVVGFAGVVYLLARK